MMKSNICLLVKDWTAAPSVSRLAGKGRPPPTLGSRDLGDHTGLSKEVEEPNKRLT